MTKRKKTYCAVSFVFAVTVLMVVLFLTFAQTRIYAASMDAGNITGADGAGDGAADGASNGISIEINNENAAVSTPVKTLLLLTVITLAPSILIMLTSYTRIIIVLHFLRTAIGTQTAPPNQVLVGLALFLTFFIMWPTFQEINENAIKPLDEGQITMEEALKEAEIPIRAFIRDKAKLQEKDLKLFVDISSETYGDSYESYDDVPMTVVIPAFIVHELRAAFIMGFMIYVPFIVIDMVVASVLMSMGMMMLPPTTVSLPFKILLFILADGWNLVIQKTVETFL